MNYFSNSRKIPPSTTFEIHQTEDAVTIITRDRGTNRICQIVSFSGQVQAKAGPCREYLTQTAPSPRRW